MENKKANLIKGFFVCDSCRQTCIDGSDSIGLYGPNSCVFSSHPRKQYIRCLGKYCDIPCKLRRKESDITIDKLITLVKYLTKELNKHLMD